MNTPLMKYQSVDVHDEEAVERILFNDEWDLQQKLDGHRVRLHKVGDEFFPLASNGGPSKSAAARPGVERLIEDIRQHQVLGGADELMLDCEVISDEYHVFDVIKMIAKGGLVSFNLHGHERWNTRRAVMDYVGAYGVNIVRTAQTSYEKRVLWAAIQEAGVEGAIAKHIRGTVTDGKKRTDRVLKLKITHTADVFVLERGPGNGKNGTGNWLRFGVFENGEIVEAGRCSIIGKPFADVNDVIEVKYLYRGANGRLVQPRHMRNRPDKTPSDCLGDDLHFVSKEIL